MAAKEKKGLGTGLDVLFGANNYEEELDSQLLTLPISKVEPRQSSQENILTRTLCGIWRTRSPSLG